MVDLADLLARVSDLVGRRTLTQNEYQAWAAGNPAGGPNGDGRYPFTDPAGAVTLVKSPARAAADAAAKGPLDFGAIGDGASHPASNVYGTLAECQAVYPFATSLAQEMDWLAIQKMVKTFGGRFVSDKRSYMMVNADPASHVPLTWVAGWCSFDAGNSDFDWSAMRAKVNTTHLIENYAFQTADGWANADVYEANQIVPTTFDQGYAYCEDGPNSPMPDNGRYYEFYHNVTIPAGRWRLKYKGSMVRGYSYGTGNVNTPYVFVHMDGGGLTNSASVNPSPDATNPETTWVSFEGQFDFAVTTEVESRVKIHAGGWGTFKFEFFDLIPWPDDYAILFTRDGAPSHYFTPLRFLNANLVGPGITSGVHGFVWKSFSDLDGDLHELENVDARLFHRAIELSDGAYLLNFWNCRIMFNGAAAYFPRGCLNAGENIRFYGGSLSGNDVVFDNPGAAEFTVFGSPPDYGGQLCRDNAGIIRMVGLRHEQHSQPGRPIWHCIDSGQVIYEGSFVLMAGAPFEADTPPAQLDGSNSGIDFNGTQVYNASSDPNGPGKGRMATGPGRVTFNGHVNLGNPNNGPLLITDAPNQDVLGGAGLFEPNGFPSAASLDPSGIFLDGGVFLRSDRTMTDRWTGEDLAVDVTTDFHKEGTRSLRIRKLLPEPDNQFDCEVHLLVPLPAIGNLLGGQFFLFPNAIDGWAGDPGGPPVYYRQFWVQKVGEDQLGRPRYGGAQVFKGESDIFVPPAGSVDWVFRGFNTSFSPPSTDAADQISGRSPAWATHLLILLNCQSIPGMTFYMDDFRANFIG